MPRPTTTTRRPSCARKRPCPRGMVCNPVTKECLRRGDPLVHTLLQSTRLVTTSGPRRGLGPKQQQPASVYPREWPLQGPQPGDPGFAAYVERLLRHARLDERLVCTAGAGPTQDQWYQQVLRFLVHPRTPIHRLLVVWQLGAGKTLGMIRVLENYFADPRPKIIVFPTEAVVANFYEQLMRLDNPYRAWVMRNRSRAARDETVRDMLERGTQSRWDRPLAAPLRAFRYTIAGGTTIHKSPVIRWGPREHVAHRLSRDDRTFDHCIVLCDEAHNIIKPRADLINQANRRKVAQFGVRLARAEHAVVVAFTATPVVNDPRDARALLDLVRGRAAARDGDGGYEGYVSWFMNRPRSLYAATTPSPDQMPLRQDAIMRGEILRNYLHHRFNVSLDERKPIPPVPPKNNHSCVANGSRCKNTLASYEHLAFYYRGRKLSVGVDTGAERATKAHRIAESIADDPERRKTCVILHQESGFDVLFQLLLDWGVVAVALQREPAGSKGSSVATANARRLAAFNADDNVRGDKVRVLLLTAEQHSEGINLLHVRRIILGDLSPGNVVPRWTQVQQRIGRALRMCSHRALPPAQQRLSIELFVATHALPGYPPTLDEEKYRRVDAERTAVAAALEELRGYSVDAKLYEPVPLRLSRATRKRKAAASRGRSS